MKKLLPLAAIAAAAYTGRRGHRNWAGSGFGGTLLPSKLAPGQAKSIVAAGGRVHGWDRYAQLVTEAYDNAPMRTLAGEKSFAALQEHIIRMFQRMQSRVRVEFVADDPYASAEQMAREVKRTGVLKIYSGDNQSEAWSQPEINLMLRAVHDYAAHLGALGRGRARTFDQRGELQAYNKHLALVGCQSAATGALFTEIVGQASYFHYTGGFPEQKIVLLPQFNWCVLGEIRGFRIEKQDLQRQAF